MLSTFAIYVLWNECGVDTGKYLYARRLLNRCPIALTKDMVGAQIATYKDNIPNLVLKYAYQGMIRL